MDTPVCVSPRDSHYLELGDGTPFVPIGLNLIAPDARIDAERQGLASFEEWCRLLAASRGNFIRVWMSHAFWDVEHARSGEYDDNKAQRLKALLDIARRNGLRVKLCIEHFRSLDPAFRQIWGQKLLHRSDRGGPALETADFFTGERSRAQFKRKLAWLASRFGDDPVIFGWELWNEVNAVQAKPTAFIPWTEEMLAELHRLFPRTLAMQSLGSFDRDNQTALYRQHSLLPGNDLAQVHRYLDLGAQLEVCRGPVDILAADAVRQLLAWNPGKPVLLAESGAVEPSHTGPFKLYAADSDGVILHDVLFAPFFSGAAGPGHCWHWNHYVDRNRLWHHFARFATAVEGLDPAGEALRPLHWEEGGLRIYALAGRTQTLLWCRDAGSSWLSELAEHRPAATLSGKTIDLFRLSVPPSGGASGTGLSIRFYDPWQDRWQAPPQNDGSLMRLPDFRRSLVVRIGQNQ